MRSGILAITLLGSLTSFAIDIAVEDSVVQQDTLSAINFHLDGLKFTKGEKTKVLPLIHSTSNAGKGKTMHCNVSRARNDKNFVINQLRPVRIEKHLENQFVFVASGSGHHEGDKNITLSCQYKATSSSAGPLTVGDVNSYFISQKMFRGFEKLNTPLLIEMRKTPNTPLAAQDDSGKACSSGHSKATELDKALGKNLDYCAVESGGTQIFRAPREANNGNGR